MLFFASILAVLTNVWELANALKGGDVGLEFSVEGRVASKPFLYHNDIVLEDESGTVIVMPPEDRAPPELGSHIRIAGKVSPAPFGHIFACAETYTILGKGHAPVVATVSIDDIAAGRCDARVVRFSGVLRDYFQDEIDTKYLYLILNCNDQSVYVTIASHTRDDLARLDTLVGQKLAITGLCESNPSGCRRRIDHLLRINSLSDMETESGAATDPFSAEPLDLRERLPIAKLATLGRRRLSGRVIAVWKGCSVMIATSQGQLSRIDLAKGPPPVCGSDIEIVGFPETDLYRFNFTRALWRPSRSVQEPLPCWPTTNLTARALTSGYSDTDTYANFHGRTVRLRGIVRSLSNVGKESGRFYLEGDGCTLPVDISANPATNEQLEIGSVVEVTGVCITELDNWHPNLVFPHIKEVMVVTRTPEDLVILERPPWWTTARLVIVICSLLLALFGIFIWNRSLKVLATKRGKALANEELKRLESDLKVCERTRLAVELHDSIAQSLTGASMEIDTAIRSDISPSGTTVQHLNRALKTIDSCRSELRNCIWDLRNQALEEEDLDKAIRLTLSQTLGKAELKVRFNVPRSRFSDNTAHTILRIIRELAANAVRHGKATEIKVAGSIENGILKFSVRDNGCGFDPAICPGIADGHFGLEGIRERVASYEGTLEIESAPGRGTKVLISINAAETEDKEKL